MMNGSDHTITAAYIGGIFAVISSVIGAYLTVILQRRSDREPGIPGITKPKPDAVVRFFSIFASCTLATILVMGVLLTKEGFPLQVPNTNLLGLLPSHKTKDPEAIVALQEERDGQLAGSIISGTAGPSTVQRGRLRYEKGERFYTVGVTKKRPVNPRGEPVLNTANYHEFRLLHNTELTIVGFDTAGNRALVRITKLGDQIGNGPLPYDVALVNTVLFYPI